MWWQINWFQAKGYSARNLKYMRSFAVTWPQEAFVQGALAQPPWYHHIALTEKLQAPDLRRWYGERALDEGWSRDALVRQIESRLHDRVGNAVSNFASTIPLPDAERVQHMESFLLELGQGSAFVGRQKRLVVGDEEMYLDLLFYHFVLRRFVVVELKTVKFGPGFLGQLGAYMAVVDDTMRQPDDKPTVGLLLCNPRTIRWPSTPSAP